MKFKLQQTDIQRITVFATKRKMKGVETRKLESKAVKWRARELELNC